MMKDGFNRYAPFIQEYIYRKKWEDLREVQIEACEAILDTDKHVIIASGTASGKTEAAFFPILTLLDKNPSSSVGIMYIGPLKALINDQFERMDELLEDSGIPVHSWHGDCLQSAKVRTLRIAQGVLQITPESLESMVMKRSDDVKKLFSDLRFIVIDEIHALMGEDRGAQVLCLISRIEHLTGCKPRRVGLSATLNDYQPAMDFLSAGSDREAVAVGIHVGKQKVSLCVESFILPEAEEQAKNTMAQYYEYIYDNCHDKKCLIFSNSRGKAEEIISTMKQLALRRKDDDIFYVHHGSISAGLRHETECALRTHKGPVVAAATLTLELGIDIGDLDMVIQMGAPYTCSSFVQRLGRSGRRTGNSKMIFTNLYKKEDANLYANLPWELLRSIAIIQLYLEERWVEPFEQKKKPFSLLAHQTLSVLMGEGELTPSELAKKVLLLPVFKDAISLDEYKELLLYMIKEEYLEKTENGKIIVGLKGEKRTNHYSFYTVFQVEDTYRVVTQGREIGTLNICPKEKDVFSLAGQAWEVVSVDEKKRAVLVDKTQNAKIPSWHASGGFVHTRVVQRMKQVLAEDTVYAYLQPNAINLLHEAREYARKNKLLDSAVIPCDTHTFIVSPWVGTKQLLTLEKLFSYGIKQALEIVSVSSVNHVLVVKTELDIDICIQKLKEYEYELENPKMVLSNEQAPQMDKYDVMVPETLLSKAYLHNQMDMLTACQILKSL